MNKEILRLAKNLMISAITGDNKSQIDMAMAFYQYIDSKSYEFLSLDEANEGFILQYPQYDLNRKFK